MLRAMTAKAPPKAKKPKPSDVELEPDAWERFETTVEKVLHRDPSVDEQRQDGGDTADNRHD